MNEFLPYLIVLVAGAIAGGFVVYWLKSRTTTTRAEGIRLALFAYKEALKLPSASDAIDIAQAQAKDEADALASFATTAAKHVLPIA